MPQQPEVFLRDLERASDEAEARLTLALTSYLAVHSEEEEDDSALLFWISAMIPGFTTQVLDLSERYSSGERLSEAERGRITGQAIVVAVEAFRQAGQTDPQLLAGSGDVDRATHVRHLATSIITAVRSEVQQASARSFGFTAKTWKTRLDSKVRSSHRVLEGVTVGLDDVFVSVGYVINYPGDRTAPPQAWINCRCELAFSFNENRLAA